MELVLAVLSFGLMGTALFAVAALIFVTARPFFESSEQTAQLAPFQIIGVEDSKAAKYAQTLPEMVLARLGTLQSRMNEAFAALKRVRSQAVPGQATAQDVVETLNVPKTVWTPIEVEFKISDVDVGSLLRFLTRRPSSKNLWDISVSFPSADDGEARAFVTGRLSNGGQLSFAENAEPTIEAIVDQSAISILQVTLKEEGHEISPLTTESFRSFLDYVDRYVAVRRQEIAERKVLKQKYEALNGLSTEFANRGLFSWSDFLWLASDIAERGGDWGRAHVYYERLLTTAPESSEFREVLDKKVADVTAKLDAEREIQLATSRAEAAAAGTAGAAVGSAAAAKEIAKEMVQGERLAKLSDLPDDSLLEPVRSQIGWKPTYSAKDIKIGIVGAIPWEQALQKADVLLPPAHEGLLGDSVMRDYASTVFNTTRMIAPDATYVFTGLRSSQGATALSDLLPGLARMVRMDVDIVLFTFASSGSPDVPLLDALEAALSTTTVVVPAGNDGLTRPSTYSSVSRGAVVSAALSLEGKPTAFSSVAPRTFWALGADLPIVDPTTGAVTRRSGTTYSAALTAGALAVLFSMFPEHQRKDIVDALFSSGAARNYEELKVKGRIINIENAIEYLSERTS